MENRKTKFASHELSKIQVKWKFSGKKTFGTGYKRDFRNPVGDETEIDSAKSECECEVKF